VEHGASSEALDRPPAPWRVRPGVVTASSAGVAIATAAVVFLHYWRLDAVPPGFFVDEAGISMAATGIALDGHDEHGAAWPLYFQQFGDWKNPTLIYAVAAAFRLFGPGVVTARAVPTTFSLLTAALLGLLAWRLFGERWLAWGTFLVAAVTPWLFTTGRTVFEVSALPAFLALFLLAWRRADQTGHWEKGAGAGMALGLSAYAYSTARLFAPLLLLALVVAELSWRRWRLLLATGAGFALAVVPIALFNVEQPGVLLARFQLISVFQESHSLGESVDRVWRVYTSGFSPDLLFLRAPWIQGGELFAVLAVPLVAGLVATWGRRREPFWRLVGLGLLLAPVPAALTYDFGHDLRNLEAVPFYLVVMGLGAHELAQRLRGQRLVAGVLVALLAAQALAFLSDYFTRVPDRMADWQEAAMPSAVAAVRQEARGRPVVISSHVFAADVLFPYYSGEDIRDYRARGLAGVGAVVLRPEDRLPLGAVVLTTPDEQVPGGVVIRTVYLDGRDDWGRPTSRPAYLVWRGPTIP